MVKLLVVEDEARIASFVTKGLRAQGYDIEWAATGAEALLRMEDRAFDLEILDLGLPDIDGLEVLRELRNRGFDLPVVVLTARSDLEDRATAFRLGVCEYVTKPFAFSRLLASVRSCLEEPG